jgi:CRP-like cAMP-binding protein
VVNDDHMNDSLNAPGDRLINFKAHISGLAPLSEEAWLDLKEILFISEIGEGDYLVKEGRNMVDEVFVLEGILRAFYDSFEGNEVNVAFFQEGSVLPPHYIRTRDNRSHLNIQALSRTVYAGFNAQDFTALRYKHDCLMKYGNAIVEKDLAYKNEREILLLTKTAEERYMAFREWYPQLENSVPQYHIASYLGITPVSLSRIRRKLIFE